MRTIGLLVAVGVLTALLKGAGPMFLRGGGMPGRLRSVEVLLGPALLAALVVNQTVASGRNLVADARLVGVAVAAVALYLRASVLTAAILATVATGVVRQLV